MRSWIIALAGLALVGCMAPSGNEPLEAGETASAPTTSPSAEPAGDALTGSPAEQAEVEPTQAEPVEQTEPTAAPLPDLGVAPELENEVWLNVDAPLRLADLRGQVVLLDMWTFG
jgi:hypothetical protein